MIHNTLFPSIKPEVRRELSGCTEKEHWCEGQLCHSPSQVRFPRHWCGPLLEDLMDKNKHVLVRTQARLGLSARFIWPLNLEIPGSTKQASPKSAPVAWLKLSWPVTSSRGWRPRQKEHRNPGARHWSWPGSSTSDPSKEGIWNMQSKPSWLLSQKGGREMDAWVVVRGRRAECATWTSGVEGKTSLCGKPVGECL